MFLKLTFQEYIFSVRPFSKVIVVVYHLTIIAVGHGLLNRLLHMGIGCVQRTAGSFFYFEI